MIAWLKNSENKWERSGEELEHYVQIAVDAKAPGSGVYTLADGIAAVEKAISNPDNKHYRYELPGASMAAMRRTGQKPEETSAAPAKEKQARKSRKKNAKKSGKPEVRRTKATLDSKKAARAAAERIERTGKKTCINGHAVKAENANAADLKRTGKYFCDPCIKMYAANQKKKAKRGAKSKR